jgi:type II secretory pathway pseudopilin PulG
MVVLMTAVTILAVMTALALPNWTAISQRDKEEELIFRGLQYAEAIRVFQMRTGRYPVRLEELYKVKPRSIRMLYPDPMTEDGEWGLVYAGGPGAGTGTGTNPRGRGRGGPQQPGTPGGRNTDPNGRPLPPGSPGNTPSGLPESSQPGRPGQQAAVGPIIGVYSKAKTEKAFKVFMDQEEYDQWVFTADLVSGVANAPDRPPQVPSARTLGRPFPTGVTPQIQFNNPQQGAGGQPGQPGQPGPQNTPRVPPGAGGKPPGQSRQGFGVPVPTPPPQPQTPQPPALEEQ